MSETIVFLCHRLPFPPNKGEKIRTYHQLKFLKDMGHKIIILAPLEKNEHLPLVENIELYTIRSNFKILIYMSSFLLKKPISVSNFYSRQLQSTFDRVIKDKKVTTVICTSSSMSEYIFKSKTINTIEPKIKLLLDFMDLDSDKWKQYSQKSNLLYKWVYERENKLLSHYEKKIHDYFDYSFFISQKEVDLFHSKFGVSKKLKVIGNGIDTNEFYPLTSNGRINSPPSFLFVGVMDYKPNVDAVIWFVKYIWPSVLSIYPDATFNIVGMNPITQVTALSKIKGINITGYVDTVLPYFHKSDIFVAPFLMARGVQNKILQAFSCGIPVISSPIGAEGIDCINKKHILIANTKNEYLESIKKLLEEISFNEEIVKNSLELIKKKYSWEGVLSPLNTIISKH